MKANNLSDELQVEANVKINCWSQEIERIFWNWIQRKSWKYSSAIHWKLRKSDSYKNVRKFFENGKSAMVRSLSKSDSEDPNKIYCNKVRRNRDGGQRSEFNSDKTRLLRPMLFREFCNDKSISFCYYADKEMENDDATIIRNFSKWFSNTLFGWDISWEFWVKKIYDIWFLNTLTRFCCSFKVQQERMKAS